MVPLQKGKIRKMKGRVKVILAGMIGNALEFYDFTLYGFFSTIIAQKFFPDQGSNTTNALLMALSVYAVGFLMRPLGAVVFGHIGDKHGRKRALTLSVILMAIPTTVIGLLPSYATIGLAAPIILTLCRLLQGLCTGGEYNGAAIFVIEHQQDRRGFAGGLITSSCAIGALMGVCVGYVCTFADYIGPLETWRIPFILGIVIGFVGIYIRRSLDESPVFVEAMSQKSTTKVRKPAPIRQALAKHWRSVLCIIGAAWLNGVMYYAAFNYMSIYLKQHHGWRVHDTLLISSVALIIYAIVTPIAGALSDRKGTVALMRPTAIFVMILAIPVFLLVVSGIPAAIVLAQVIFALLAAFFSGPLNLFMQSLFPVEDRYSGISVSYSIGLAIFGGTTLLVMEALRVNVALSFAPAIWLAVSGLASTLTLVFIYPRIKIEAK
jgi:MHS family proline/betaine transporter-like MFS transporter